MIREATGLDVPAIVAMGRAFHAMSPHRGMGAFDEAGVANMLRALIAEPRALVLTNGEGAIGGVLAPIYFCPSKLMMEEAFYYAIRGGKQMLEEFCERSREMGASCVLLSTLENEKSHVIDRVVTRMGFRPVERRYVMEL
jgi:hypothetical protein